MLHRVMRKVKCFLFAIIFILFLALMSNNSAGAREVQRVVVKPKALGGFSLMWEKYLQSGAKLYEERDVDLLAEVMYHENYVNGDYVMRLTGSVVLNRVAHKGFPNTIHDVLYQKGQYATVPLFFTKPIPESVKQIARELLMFGSIADPAVVFQAMFPQGSGVWQAIPSSYSDKDIEYFCYE